MAVKDSVPRYIADAALPCRVLLLALLTSPVTETLQGLKSTIMTGPLKAAHARPVISYHQHKQLHRHPSLKLWSTLYSTHNTQHYQRGITSYTACHSYTQFSSGSKPHCFLPMSVKGGRHIKVIQISNSYVMASTACTTPPWVPTAREQTGCALYAPVSLQSRNKQQTTPRFLPVKPLLQLLLPSKPPKLFLPYTHCSQATPLLLLSCPH